LLNIDNTFDDPKPTSYTTQTTLALQLKNSSKAADNLETNMVTSKITYE
jgi:hypothetical protein